jgi:alpha-L-fucosidase 2
MTEMLLQSHLKELHLLPALPKAWASGSISGLKARGAFTVDMEWSEGNLRSAVIKSGKGGICVIRTGNPISVDGITVKAIKSGSGYLTTFVTRKGISYKIKGQ